MTARATATVLCVLVLSPATAAAKRRYAKGFYAEMGVGTTGFLGQTGEYAAVGPSLAIRSGYDVFSWFSIGGLLATSMHEATVPPPPEEEFFQLYQVAADGRLTLRYRRLALFAEGSAGAALISTNVLDKVAVTTPDSHATPVFGVGGGIDYHTQNRHFSLGAGADWTLYPGFEAAQALTVRIYLRYAR